MYRRVGGTVRAARGDDNDSVGPLHAAEPRLPAHPDPLNGRQLLRRDFVCQASCSHLPHPPVSPSWSPPFVALRFDCSSPCGSFRDPLHGLSLRSSVRHQSFPFRSDTAAGSPLRGPLSSWRHAPTPARPASSQGRLCLRAELVLCSLSTFPTAASQPLVLPYAGSISSCRLGCSRASTPARMVFPFVELSHFRGALSSWGDARSQHCWFERPLTEGSAAFRRTHFSVFPAFHEGVLGPATFSVCTGPTRSRSLSSSDAPAASLSPLGGCLKPLPSSPSCTSSCRSTSDGPSFATWATALFRLFFTSASQHLDCKAGLPVVVLLL